MLGTLPLDRSGDAKSPIYQIFFFLVTSLSEDKKISWLKQLFVWIKR